MTEKTVILGIRLNRTDKEILSKYITRSSLESLLRQIKRGEIEITDKGVKIKSVNTTPIQSVNTSECDTCPYMNGGLKTGDFEDACHAKNQDPQKTLDKCTQMVWKA